MKFTLHDLTDFYIERVTAHRIQIIDPSCFHDHWPTSKMKLNEDLFESKGALRSLRILLIGRIGSGCDPPLHLSFIYRC